MWSTPGLLLITNLLSVNALSRRQEDGSRLLGSSIGYMRPGSLSDAQASESTVDALFEAAGRQPNETRSVSFNFDPGNLSESNADTTWTWLVNTTDLAVPEQVIPGDLRVVNQQWALQWPGGGNLESALNRWGIEGNRTQQLCIGAATWSLLPNVTSRYVDAEPGDCSAVLGTDCADRIRTQSLIGLDGRCGALSGRFDECADSIGSNTGGSLGSKLAVCLSPGELCTDESIQLAQDSVGPIPAIPSTSRHRQLYQQMSLRNTTCRQRPVYRCCW